jgi:hypothetical protein
MGATPKTGKGKALVKEHFFFHKHNNPLFYEKRWTCYDPSAAISIIVDDTEENRKRVEDIFGPCEF